MTHPRPANVYNGAAYEIPLSDDQLRYLGLLSAVWAQIDYLISMTISAVMQTNPYIVETLLSKQMTGARLAILREQLPNIQDEATKKAARQFCNKMGGLIEKRNHITHGLWTWKVDQKTKQGHRISHYKKNKDKPIYANEIENLLPLFEKECKNIFSVLHSLRGEDITPDGYAQIFVSDGPPLDSYPELL